MGRRWMDTSLVDMKFMDDSFVDSPFVDKEIVGHEKHGRHVNQMLQERHRLRYHRRRWEVEPHRVPAAKLPPPVDYSGDEGLCDTLIPRTGASKHLPPLVNRSSVLLTSTMSPKNRPPPLQSLLSLAAFPEPSSCLLQPTVRSPVTNGHIQNRLHIDRG
ncbi:hypothetical protein DY000_02020493 [Brassica cretica]|uniref:Uncharacterized protein n=1 Tax=Brassica cretica TaxID=69181 RepID=A0ABQ7EHI5_BRACR|nr:hypothetical protein DY000_02020493 [Brassica cretica]